MPGREQSWRALFIVVAGLLALLAPASALAQGEGSGPPDEARAVFLRATELYETRSYARAELEFRRAWELMEGHPRRALVLVNIARCVESVPGREAEALALYEQALAETNALAAHDAGIRDARRIAEERVAELNARMAVQAREPAGAEERSESQPGAASVSFSSTRPSESADGDISPVGPIVLGVGGAMMLAGAITGALALGEHDKLTGMCDPGAMRCPAALRERVDGLAALSISTDVLLWGGLAVAATGALLSILDETGCAALVTGSF